ncbi:ROK family protein [Flavitalea flava]
MTERKAEKKMDNVIKASGENKIVGIDIGGSHISACLVDLDSATLLDHSFTRAKTNPHGSAEEIINAWAVAIENCFAWMDTKEQNATGSGYPKTKSPLRIGIAMPGPFDYDKGISYITGLHKFESLYGLNIKELLATRLKIPVEHIKFLNDASAFLLGEIGGGAGKGYTRAAGVTLGTGLGSAGYVDSVLHDGDLWSTPFKESRAEDYLCTRWFIQEYAELQKKEIHGVKDLIPLFESDAGVRSLFATFGRHLAEAIIMKYPPSVQEVIIIGGNISKAWELFVPSTLEHAGKLGVPLNLRQAVLGENAAVMGAAFLWKK